MKTWGKVIVVSLFALFIPRGAEAAVIHPEDYFIDDGNNNHKCSAFDEYDDTWCWQSALTDAKHGGTELDQFNYGTVEGEPRGRYVILDTLTLSETQNGIVDGRGCYFEWRGPADRPLFKLIDTWGIDIRNIHIKSSAPAYKLHTAFEFTNGSASNVTPSQNMLEHINVEGTNLNGLQYGVRFTLGAGGDNNNDLNVITHSQFLNVTTSAVSIEHSQSYYHKLVEVTATGAPGAAASSFVNLTAGSFTVDGASGGGFTDADYVIDGIVSGNLLIVHHNSEDSARLLRDDGVSTAGDHRIQFIGGRFAVNRVTADGKLVWFEKPGPLSIEGMTFDANELLGSSTPKIYFAPHVSTSPAGEGSLVFVGNKFIFPGASTYDPLTIVTSSNSIPKINVHSNSCFNSTSEVLVACKGVASGMRSTSGIPYTDLSASPAALPNGHDTYCTDCKADTASGACVSGGSGAMARRIGGSWKCSDGEVLPASTQALTNKDLTSATNSFPSSLTTLTDSQSLTNKTMTDSTNVFPQFANFVFWGPGPTTNNGNRWFGPNNAQNSTGYTAIGAPVPALVMTKLICRSDASIASSRSWTISLQNSGFNANDIGSCVLSSTQNPCSVTGASSYGANGVLTIKATASNPAPSTGNIICTAIAAN